MLFSPGRSYIEVYEYNMLINKKHLNLLVNDNIIKKAREHNINISVFLEIKLQEHLALIEGNSNNKTNNQVGLLRFELKSMAPEATRIPSYPTSPNLLEYINSGNISLSF